MKRPHHEISGESSQSVAPKPTPKVSRKVSACTECQSRKIKCDLAPGVDICTRCNRKGLKCVVNKSLQSLLEEESKWKTDMETESKQLQLAVAEILRTLSLPPLDTFGSSARQAGDGKQSTNFGGQAGQPSVLSPSRLLSNTPGSGNGDRPLPGVRFLSELPSPNAFHEGRRPNHAAGMAMTRENSQDIEADESNDNGLVSAPMGTLFEVTKLRNLRSNPRATHGNNVERPSMEEDFIATGQVGLEDAERLFDRFNRTLNHYLWGGIALVYGDLASVRRSSSLLLAAILTVTALHVPGMENVFDVCYAEFVSRICASMLDRHHDLDGVRALAIGAFWLSDLSWKLSGHAIRIATELNLHQSYAKAMKGSQEHFEGARLWYLLYVCDHHFSIAYGRPPVIHEDYSIVHHEKFLHLPQIAQADHRLHSQVSIFSILTEMYYSFGADVGLQLTEDDLHRIRHFNHRLDSWKSHWELQLAPNQHIASYPAKGVGLHYHYGKLQLNALALRGYRPMSSFELSPSRRDCANIAISCAQAILNMVLDEPDIREGLVGVPLYLHTMITFAATFLLKVHQKWKRAQLGTDLIIIESLVVRIIALLREAKASQRHLTYHMANGLNKMLDKFMAWEKREMQPRHSLPPLGQMPPTPDFTQVAPMGYDINYNLGMFTDPLQLYDDSYFPAGFFDVLSSAMPE